MSFVALEEHRLRHSDASYLVPLGVDGLRSKVADRPDQVLPQVLHY